MAADPVSQVGVNGDATSPRDSASGSKAVPVQRRLIWQLLDYWETKRRGRDFPSLDDIDPDEIADVWPYCFILDVENFRHTHYFHYLGPKLARYSGVFLSGRHNLSRTLLKKAVCHYREAIERRTPVLVEEDLVQYDNRHLLFRSVLLPLSDDGTTINFMLGAANGKIKSP